MRSSSFWLFWLVSGSAVFLFVGIFLVDLFFIKFLISFALPLFIRFLFCISFDNSDLILLSLPSSFVGQFAVLVLCFLCFSLSMCSVFLFSLSLFILSSGGSWLFVWFALGISISVLNDSSDLLWLLLVVIFLSGPSLMGSFPSLSGSLWSLWAKSFLFCSSSRPVFSGVSRVSSLVGFFSGGFYVNFLYFLFLLCMFYFLGCV